MATGLEPRKNQIPVAKIKTTSTYASTDFTIEHFQETWQAHRGARTLAIKHESQSSEDRERMNDQRVTIFMCGSSDAPLVNVGGYSFSLMILIDEDEGMVGATPLRVDQEPEICTARCQIARSVDDGVTWHWSTFPAPHYFCIPREDFARYTHHIRSFFTVGIVRRAEVRGKLMLRFTVELQGEHPIAPVYRQVMRDLRIMRDQRQSADTTLIMKGGILKVHSAVIALHSPVFESMLFGPMAGTETKTIQLEDIDIAVGTEIVDYMYTRSIRPAYLNHIDIVAGLMRAADKYAIVGLLRYLVIELCQVSWPIKDLICYLTIADELGVREMRSNLISALSRDMDTLDNAQDLPEFDALSGETRAEIFTACSNRRKRRARENEKEFPEGSDWSRMSVAQLRRACMERDLPSDGDKVALVATLNSAM